MIFIEQKTYILTLGLVGVTVVVINNHPVSSLAIFVLDALIFGLDGSHPPGRAQAARCMEAQKFTHLMFLEMF